VPSAVVAPGDGGVDIVDMPFNTDRRRAKESFRRLAEQGVTTGCFGHGDPLLGERTGLPAAAAGGVEVPDPLG
jgi:hypothetical protein